MSSPRPAAPPVDFVSAYATASAEFADGIAGCDMSAPVMACPGWSSYDLVCHLGNVHSWAATIVETGRAADELDDRPPSRRNRSVVGWYLAKAEDLLAVLRAAAPDRPCWTFSALHHTAGFWPRRQTHETLVHLVDLHRCSGSTTDLPPRLAADGVAEVLEVFLPRMHARGFPAQLGAPVLLEATDTGHAWLVTPATDGGPPVVSRPGEVPGPFPVPRQRTGQRDAVSGTAADLMLLLWKRLPADHPGIVLTGDPTTFLGSRLTP